MGSPHSRRTTRCCYAAYFSLGFVIATLLLAAMFWIIWCYFGLSIVQISDTQRRAVVNYSFTTPKSPITPGPSNRTESDEGLESSLNSISKSGVTVSSVLRGSSRGESPPPRGIRDKYTTGDSALSKGDFAARPLGGNSQNITGRESPSALVTSSPQERQASILTAGEDDGLHARRVSTSNTENRAQDTKERLPDISPTQTHQTGRTERPLPPVRDEKRPLPRESGQRDQIESSRPAYRKPEFKPEQRPRTPDRVRDRYDDDEDERRSPSRYDKRDRGRETDDRYSKGDTRVYPDERPSLDDRYRDDDKYSSRDEKGRRGDDSAREDRYRYRDEDRYRDDDRYKVDDRYRDDDRYKVDDRYRDDDRYKADERYRDGDRYRDQDRLRDGDRYKDDDRYRLREDRYRDDVRRRDRTYEDTRYVGRDSDDQYRPREDRYRYRDDERYRDEGTRSVDRDRYNPRGDVDRYTPTRDRDYRIPITNSRPDEPLDRKIEISDPVLKDDNRRISDYDSSTIDRPRSSLRGESRLEVSSKPVDDRYSDRDDEYRRPPRYDDRDRISPTRIRDETYVPRPSLTDERRREDVRYSDDRSRSKYYDDDVRRTDETRSISPSSVRETDNKGRASNRDEYRTVVLEDRTLDAKYVDRGDDVVLDRRSYGSEEDDEYQRGNPRARPYISRDKLSGDSRRDYRDDKEYPRRIITDTDEYPRRTRTDTDEYPKHTRTDIDEYPRRTRTDIDEYPRRTRTEDDEYIRSRPRGDDASDRSRIRDRYDRPYDERYVDEDNKSASRKYNPEYESARRRDEANVGLRKEVPIRDSVENNRKVKPPPEISEERLPVPPRDKYPETNRRYADDPPPRRSSSRNSTPDDRFVRPRPDTVDSRPLRPVIDKYPEEDQRYKEDTSRYPDDSSRSVRRDPFISSSTSPMASEALHEKRYQNSRSKIESSGRGAASYLPAEVSSVDRPLNAKDVIDAALRHSDVSDQSPRKVFYPVFDPRVSNLTSPDIIRPSERRGTTIMSRRRRRRSRDYI